MGSSMFQRLLDRRRNKNRPQLRRPQLLVELLERREMLTAFTPGNLIVLRAGDGTSYNATAPLYLDEYTTSGSFVQTVNIPNSQQVGGPGNQPITMDLSAAAGNGQLNRSYDGSSLTFCGLDAHTNVASSTATGSADRVLAVAGKDPSANLDTTTHGQFYVGDDCRGGVAEGAAGPVWAVGHPNQAGGAVSQGVHYFPALGPSIGTQVSAGANIRGGTISFENRFYFSTAGSTQTGLAGIYTEAQPLPTNPNPTSDVPVVSALFSASKLGGIYLADMDGTGVLSNGDRLYFIDDGTVGGAGTGGLYVSTYNTAYPGNHWSTAVRLGDGIIDGQPHPQATAQLRGLAGTVIGPTQAALYVSEFDNVAGNNSYILKFNDQGTGVAIASASESGNLVTITTALPNTFSTGQTVAVDGIDAGLGGSALVTDGYNGTWSITVVDSTHFTYINTNTHNTNLPTVTNQGAADVAVTPSIVTSLADGAVTIGSKNVAAEGLRGVAFAPVSPTAVTLTVNGSSNVTVPPNTQVTFVATLTNSQVTPTGVVTFIDQNTNAVLGQGTITTNGGITTASFSTVLVGNHFVTAYFPGGGAAALAPATSGAVTVNEAGTTASNTALTPSLAAAAVGVPVTLTATVSGGAGTPTGTVSFYDGTVNYANLLGTSSLSGGGVATLAKSFNVIQTHHLTAVYNGNNTYASSQVTTDVVVAANATAKIKSSANDVPPGSTPTYTVTLKGNASLGTPAGTVQFYLDGVALGGPKTLGGGPGYTATATVTSTALSAGSHFVTISWSATLPYSSFALDTTTSANGVAFIETALKAFTPGNLVAVQRGDGTVNLGSSGYLVFLDEYTPSGTLVQKIAMPNVNTVQGQTKNNGSARSAGNKALLLSGQSGAEGLLNRSADGYYLTLTGYDVPVGRQFVTSTFPYQYPRTIARVDGSGNVDTSTAIFTGSDVSVPYNPLDVVSNDGNEFWLVSNLNTGNETDSGILYVDHLGATTALQIGPADTAAASILIAGGQLYAATNDSTGGVPVGIWHVGTGLPTSQTTVSTLPGLQAAYQSAFPNQQNPEQLLFFNHNDGTSNNPDTLFIADQSNGLLKFWFDGTNWRYGNAGGTFGQKLLFAGGITGVVGQVVNPGPNAQFRLYVTGSNVQGQNPNQIATFLDTNAYNNGFTSGNFSTLAFVGDNGTGSPNGNENFAGLAFVPAVHTSPGVSSSRPESAVGQAVIFTATVSSPIGVPTGAVTFYDGPTVLGTATLNESGVAVLSVSTLGIGTHSIRAFYNGDVMNGTSLTDVLSQTITPAAPTGAAAVARQASQHVAMGHSLLHATFESLPSTATQAAPLQRATTGQTSVLLTDVSRLPSAAPVILPAATADRPYSAAVGTPADDAGEPVRIRADAPPSLLHAKAPRSVSLDWDADSAIGG
jgi:hypothetical protein